MPVPPFTSFHILSIPSFSPPLPASPFIPSQHILPYFLTSTPFPPFPPTTFSFPNAPPSPFLLPSSPQSYSSPFLPSSPKSRPCPFLPARTPPFQSLVVFSNFCFSISKYWLTVPFACGLTILYTYFLVLCLCFSYSVCYRWS